MLFEKTYDEILAASINELTRNTRLTRLSPGAKARSILEVVARHTNDAYKTFDLNLARAFVSGANGRFLDFIGNLLGVERLGVVAAQAGAEAKTVRFFVESGTFGDINSGASILLPSNTIVSSTDATSGVRYRLTNAVTLSSIASEQYVAVQALLPGTSQNIGADVLTFHNFIAYTDAANNTLQVTNDQGIANGQDIEQDTNYRFRITHQVTAAEAANLTAIRLATLTVPGVADMVFIPYARGIGTYDVILKSITPTVADSLINAVQSSIGSITAQGIVARAAKPIETGITFLISVRHTQHLPNKDRLDIEGKIRTSLTDYVNGLDIGEEFVINEAVQRVMQVDERIKDIGIPTKPFDDLTIYKPTRLQDNKIKSTLIKNYPAANNERLIIEPTVSSPIIITTKL